RRARLPALLRGRRVRSLAVRAPRRAVAADDRRAAEREAGGPLADAARPDLVHRPAGEPPGASRLRQLLRLPARGRRREDRPAAAGARRRGGSRLAAIAHGDRPDLRPRRDGALARGVAAEDVQRLRGDDPRPARFLQPVVVPSGREHRCARLARGSRADAALDRGRPTHRNARRRGYGGRARWRRAGGAAEGHLGRGPRAEPSGRAREQVLFTYDDHQAGTARQEAPGQPNRVRCVRDGRFKYAAYLDPAGRAAPEHELYDLDADPLEVRNLLERDTAYPRTTVAARELRRLRELLAEESARTGTATPGI